MFFGMSFPFLGRGIGGLGDMNNKFLPTETSAPFSCNPWVVFLLIVCFGVVGFFSFIYQQSFFFPTDIWVFLKCCCTISSSPN